LDCPASKSPDQPEIAESLRLTGQNVKNEPKGSSNESRALYQRSAGFFLWVARAKREETRQRRFARLMKDSENGRRLDNVSPKIRRQSAK